MKENIDLKLYHVYSHFQCIFVYIATITGPDEMKHMYKTCIVILQLIT